MSASICRRPINVSSASLSLRSGTPVRAGALADNVDETERVEAFVSRFGRLQDTLGDKLLPLYLQALGERRGATIDNLDRAENSA